MVCRIKNLHTFKSMPILNSAYFTECRFVIRHITQTDTETETEANFTHVKILLCPKLRLRAVIVALFGVGAPPSGKSWIRHWYI